MTSPTAPQSEPQPSEYAAYEYAIVRVVPNEARGEFINAGVILFCPALKFLQARISFDPKKLLALAPHIDLPHAEKHLAAIPKICEGGIEAGELAALSMPERFRWLTSPRNTLIQTSPIHSGLTQNPQATLDHLRATLA